MAHGFAVLRLLFVLAIVVPSVIGPATPISAQSAQVDFTCGPSGTASPCAVPTGGQIVVTGSEFTAEQCRTEASIDIGLINDATGGLTPLGTTFFSSCGDFGGFRFPSDSGTFTLPPA